MKSPIVALLSLFFLPALAAAGNDTARFNAELALEGRYFGEASADWRQSDTGVSVAVRPEWYRVWNGGHSSLTVAPFGRWDQHDSRRTHFDLRELFLRHRRERIELRAGIRTVFWGVTEAVNLVNIINQTDLVENPDGDDKLGQPMIDFSWFLGETGKLEGFLLPYHRQRTLPGREGRLRAATPFDEGEPIYESADGERHLDHAARYSVNLGSLDLGLSYFDGTARQPRFTPRFDGAETVLTPTYDLIRQAGLDTACALGNWLLKLEAVHRQADGDAYSSAAAGFEHTFNSALGAADVGVLAEYLWDERGTDVLVPFQNDVFVGLRLAANDIASTSLLAGGIFDMDGDQRFINIEASRRLRSASKIALEIRLFQRIPDGDALAGVRQDSYGSLELTHYF